MLGGAGTLAFAAGWLSVATLARGTRSAAQPLRIEVAGLEQLAPRRLERRLAAAPAARLAPAVLRERLLADPWIAEVRISAALPGRLLVRVVEREPAALVAGKTEHWIVDRAGVPLERVSAENRPELPRLVTQRRTEPGVRDPAVVAGLGALAQLEAAGLRVAEWRLSGQPSDAYPQAILRGLDPPVIFGAGDRIDQLERLAQALGLAEVLQAGAIDLRFDGQVVLVPRSLGGGSG